MSDDDECLYEGRWLRLLRRGRWEFAQRTNAPPAAVSAALVVATTANDEIVLVEQTRAPFAARTIELPAGLVGDDIAGEGAADAAARELTEETGFRADTLEMLVEGCVSAGLSDERLILVRARGLVRIGPGGGVGHEDIVVHLVRIADAEQFLADARSSGILVDLKVYTGLWFATRPTPRG